MNRILPEQNKFFYACDIKDKQFYIVTEDHFLMSGDVETMEMHYSESIDPHRLLSVRAGYLRLVDGWIYVFDHYVQSVCCLNGADIHESHYISLFQEFNEVVRYYPIIVIYETNIYFATNVDASIYRIHNGTKKRYPLPKNFDNEIDWKRCFGCMHKDKIYLYSSMKKSIVTFDMETNEFSLMPLSEPVDNVSSIKVSDEKICILDGTGEYRVFGYMTDKIKRVSLPLMGKMAWGTIVNTKKCDLILPGLQNVILQVDQDVLVTEIKIPEHINIIIEGKWVNENYRFLEYCEDAEHFYFSCRMFDHLLKINKISGAVEWIAPRFPLVSEKVRLLYMYNDVLVEQKEYLQGFFDAMQG